MKLPPIEIKEPNNVTPYWEVAGRSATTAGKAAIFGYQEGASMMASMVRDLIDKRDMQGLMQLLNATDKKSFYGEPN